MSEHTFDFQVEVPDHFLDEDGNVKPAFYEPLFSMLGKEYGGAVVNSIVVDFPDE